MSTIPKLLESILLPKLNFVFSNYIIPQQFGFRSHTSTSSNLVAYHKYLMDTIEKGGQVDAIYTDISKAFDTINHAVLIRKSELMGVDNIMLKWLSSYISGRSQKVKLHGYVSNNISIPSGVPQGGHISSMKRGILEPHPHTPTPVPHPYHTSTPPAPCSMLPDHLTL